MLAFAAVPVALSLVVWPVKLALYGEDVFRTGGSDSGAGAHVFTVLWLVFLAWAVVLLVIGVRAVHGWSWSRSVGACLHRKRRARRPLARVQGFLSAASNSASSSAEMPYVCFSSGKAPLRTSDVYAATASPISAAISA